MAKRTFDERLAEYKEGRLREFSKKKREDFDFWEVQYALKNCSDEELKNIGYFRTDWGGIFRSPPKRRLRSDKAREKIYAYIDEKHAEMERRINSEDGEKWRNFYEKCKEPADDKYILRDLKKEGVIKETGKPLRVSFFLKDGSAIRTVKFADELFYTKMGMLYHFNINKKDYFPGVKYGFIPVWFKCLSHFRAKEDRDENYLGGKWVNVWSEKQIRYYLEIMEDMKYLVGCKPHHYWEHEFDKPTKKYLEQVQTNLKKMAFMYAKKFGVGKWVKNEETGKKEFKIINDANIIFI